MSVESGGFGAEQRQSRRRGQKEDFHVGHFSAQHAGGVGPWSLPLPDPVKNRGTDPFEPTPNSNFRSWSLFSQTRRELRLGDARYPLTVTVKCWRMKLALNLEARKLSIA